MAITGSPEDITRAKVLIAALDLPSFDTRYLQIYRLRNVDAQSVAELVRHAFPNLAITVDAGLDALSVIATATEHQRIAEGIAQLDGTANGANGAPGISGGSYGGPGGHEIVALRSILPADNKAKAARRSRKISRKPSSRRCSRLTPTCTSSSPRAPNSSSSPGARRASAPRRR